MTTATLVDRPSCPLCRSDEAAVFIPFPEIPVLKCQSCGFMYSSKILSGEDLTKYYENGFGSQRHLQGQQVNSLVNSMALERLINVKEITSILDIGTGYGFLLKELCLHHGWDTTGVELSQQEAEYAKSKLGLNVINSLLSDSGLQKSAYDLVTSFEVIEHVPYPTKFLLELTEYIKPGGYLLVMTDNFDSRIAKSLGAGFPKWIPHSHISHFSAATLRKALEDTENLEILKAISYTPWETLLRNSFYRLLGINKMPSDVFDLKTILKNEMHGTYKFFSLRKVINTMWAELTINEKMDGDLMYFLCKKNA